jgi:hypothetical protein
MLKPKNRELQYPDVSGDTLFVEWCAGIEWATAAPADSRDALLNEVVKRAKKLLDGKSGT